ncbi:hypothetical protein SISNIDRAFT_484416 [Sistotremastrum niveocremeum HHB9708]|uniref:Uncharacterized protein n=1 Tax=Sistotremastrum niveocremeum HHB9708 TaxID=1314777 RepID=A0A164WAW7_9AGAM|nr:hypothetical protein SISNIDRAFT_484416 [Sistotremastrum niveocremeum HHB9708]
MENNPFYGLPPGTPQPEDQRQVLPYAYTPGIWPTPPGVIPQGPYHPSSSPIPQMFDPYNHPQGGYARLPHVQQALQGPMSLMQSPNTTSHEMPYREQRPASPAIDASGTPLRRSPRKVHATGTSGTEATRENASNHASSAAQEVDDVDEPTAPVKRGRGRPRGSKTGQGGGRGGKKSTGGDGRATETSKAKKRKAENSDDEVADLDPKLAASVAVVVPGDAKAETEDAGKKRKLWRDEEIVAMVGYITQESIFPDFKLNKHAHFIKIAESICPRFDAGQIDNKWKKIWITYRVCKKRESHTGGADGDEPRQLEDKDAVSAEDLQGVIGDIENVDDSEKYVPGSGNSEGPDVAETVTLVGGKPVRIQKGSFGGISVAILEPFARSEVYRLLDKVAYDHPEVTRDTKYSSSKKVKDEPVPKKAKLSRSSSPDPEDRGTEFSQILAHIQRRDALNSKLTQRQLELAELQERRQQEQQAREIAAAEAANKLAAEEQQAKRWAQASDWAASTHPILRAKGERMLQQLAAEDEQAGQM